MYLYRKKYSIKNSPIHGVGLFAKEDIGPGEIIDCAIKTQDTTFIITQHFGKFINHSKTGDNVVLIQLADGYYIKTIKSIPKNTEIMVNYDGPTIPSFIQGSLPHYI